MPYVGHGFRLGPSSFLPIIIVGDICGGKTVGTGSGADGIRETVLSNVLTDLAAIREPADRRTGIDPDRVLIAGFLQFEGMRGYVVQPLPDHAKRLRMCKRSGCHA
jgi:hypothetical protein